MRPQGPVLLIATAILWAGLRTAFREGNVALGVGTVVLAGLVIRAAKAMDGAVVQYQVGRTASIEVPPHLADEFRQSDPKSVDALQAWVIDGLNTGTPTDQIIEDAQKQGWSAPFSSWLVYLLESNRGGIKIRVPK